jgi:hypothetical protein
MTNALLNVCIWDQVGTSIMHTPFDGFNGFVLVTDLFAIIIRLSSHEIRIPSSYLQAV